MNKFSLVLALLLLLTPTSSVTGVEDELLIWRGLVVADENRCTDYHSWQYRHSPKVEYAIVKLMRDRIYSPYTGEYFDSIRETDIEHIIAKSEAHDSGMCSRSNDEKSAFSSDLLNLTLAAPRLNRYKKRAKDAAEWLPDFNRCWFASRVLEVRRKYSLTIDAKEANILEAVLLTCSPDRLIFSPR